MRERKIYQMQKRTNLRRQKIVQFQKKILAFAVLGIFIFSALIVTGMKVQADSSTTPDRIKYYTDVTVDRNDSLWNIATSYITEEYTSVNDYIEEIMEVNSIVDADSIRYGQHLVVPYFK